MTTELERPYRGHLRGRRTQRLTHGIHLPLPTPGTEHSRLARLHGWKLVLPPSGGFTHVTAAEVYGWHLPALPTQAPVFAATHVADGRPRRPGLRVTRHPAPPRLMRRRGLPVLEPAEVLLATARDFELLDLTILLDSALHLGDITAAEVVQVARGRPGGRMLRRALEHADHRAESPWETVLRLFHTACGVEVVPQYELRDAAGRHVAKGDLWLRGTSVLHEYDGGVHRDPQQHRKDLARERAIGRVGWTRRGYTAVDLLHHPGQILDEADAALGRPHDPRRLDAWRVLLERSSLSQAGRSRLLARWLPPTPGT